MHNSPIRMVYVHGGFFLGGTAQRVGFPALVSRTASVIIVSLNYRLTGFGFLGADALRERDPDSKSTGNYAIQDQRLGE
jgi:carboxylesterase type B